MSRVYIVNSDIIDRYARGESCRAIAKRYGVAIGTISRALKLCGIKVDRKIKYRPWTEEEVQLIRRLRRNGTRAPEIAELIGRSKRSVNAKFADLRRQRKPEPWLRRQGVDYRSKAA